MGTNFALNIISVVNDSIFGIIQNYGSDIVKYMYRVYIYMYIYYCYIQYMSKKSDIKSAWTMMINCTNTKCVTL